MKSVFTLLFAFVITGSLMAQSDMQELKKQRDEKRSYENLSTLEMKKSRTRDHASRQVPRQASTLRSSSLKAQNAGGQKLDSLISELFDLSASEWVRTDRELFTFDEEGNMTTYIWFAYDSVAMEILPYDKEIVKYNEEGQPTEIIWQIWDVESGQWVNWGRYELAYDEQGNLVRETISDWDPDASQWWVGAEFEMTYDASGMQLTQIWYFWDEDTGELVLTFKDEYVYEDGKQVTWYEYVYEEGEWVLIFRTTYTYGPEGNLLEELTEAYDSFSGEWLDFGRKLNTYNESNQLIKQEVWEFDWDSFVVVQTWLNEYTWDSNGNMLEQVEKAWDGGAKKGSNAWVNAFKTAWTYNTDYNIPDLYLPYWFLQNTGNLNFVNMPLSELDYVYVEGDWVFDMRQTTYWSDFEGPTSVQEMQESVIQVFPVPATQTLTFSWEASHTQLQLDLYDLTGKRVLSRSVGNRESVEIEELKGGLYLYKLSHQSTLIYSGKLAVE